MFTCMAEAPASSPVTSTAAVEDPFNGYECDATGNPQPRFVCGLGKPLSLPVHWAPDLGPRGRTIPCGRQDNKPCPRCVSGIPNKRRSLYYPALFSAKLSRLLGGHGQRTIWHVPGNHKSRPEGVGKVFEVWRDRRTGKQHSGNLCINETTHLIRTARAHWFDPAPIVVEFFRSIVPDLVIEIPPSMIEPESLKPTQPSPGPSTAASQPANANLASMKAMLQSALTGIGGSPS